MGRERYAKQSLGALHGRVKEARVLMVGAGGIGCELLKNLVLTGFGEVHVVDLDTIDLSNLNRQFLFRHEHIKKPKALVAKESAGRFNPNVKIEAYHANIKDKQFDMDWYKQFAVVFNALDNLDARRWVNKMCIASDVPLVDGGTTGFSGSVRFIKQGVSECYDCVPKDPPKSFPICTIRSTPSQPIHCIVWGKSYLFTEVFGVSEDEAAAVMDVTEDADNKKEIEDLQKEAEALKAIRESMGSENFPRLVFDKVFKDDIVRLRSVEGFWDNGRRPPEPLDFDKLSDEINNMNGAEIAQRDQAIWTLAENFAVFLDSLKRLSNRMMELRRTVADETPILTFDKDDVDTLDFVCASSNLRSHIFGIETPSKFDIKQIAGNIIPAVATTNAIFAGLMVLHAMKVMKGLESYQKAPMVFSNRSADRLLSAEKGLRPPNSDCVVCGIARTIVVIDPTRATLGHIVEDVLKDDLGYSSELAITSNGELLYDPDEEEILPKLLADLKFEDGGSVVVQDGSDEPKIDLEIRFSFQYLPDSEKPVQVNSKPELPAKKPKVVETAPMNGTTNGTMNGTKRKRTADEAGLEEGGPKKKGKLPADVASVANGSIIVLDDEEPKPIMIDDD